MEGADENDERREEALALALNSTARLIFAQFSEVNTAGHLHGASYADGSAYTAAVASKAALLRRVKAAIDAPGAPPTTLLVLSDHGHLQRGGTGGGTADERDAPLLAYRPKSALGLQADDEPSYQECISGELSTIDIAPTIAALLGVPTPRHSQGHYIRALFDGDAAEGQTTEAGYAAVDAQRAAMGWQLFRGLEMWQWRDAYHARALTTNHAQQRPTRTPSARRVPS